MRSQLQFPMFFMAAFVAIYAAFVWLGPKAVSIEGASARETMPSTNRAYEQLRAEVQLFAPKTIDRN